ncbi:hypothetical protein AB9P05_02255 [Roseivirga sp. BDSF3-8]|uniref:hypothetical protein n=1 Tax=Roseivirga sp. BDSF3-8 TaxID=3241598 RepID=UPI003531A942
MPTWRSEGVLRLLEVPTMIDQRLDYIHQNPVAAGYVLEPEHYPYSSAVDYAGAPFKAIGVRERVLVVFIE